MALKFYFTEYNQNCNSENHFGSWIAKFQDKEMVKAVCKGKLKQEKPLWW